MAILTVSLAVAPSLIFWLVGRAVLPPLPYERPDELVAVWQRGEYRLATSYPKLRLLREASRTMDVAACGAGVVFLSRDGESVRLGVGAVTPNFFSVLGARPLLGRTFREDENLRPFEHPLIVLSEWSWRKHFDARPEIVGERLALNGETFAVVGVMPASFQPTWQAWRGGEAPAGWIPAMMHPVGLLSDEWRHSARSIEDPRAAVWMGVGRLREGYRLPAARAEAEVLAERVKALWPDPDGRTSDPFEVARLSEEAADPEILHAVGLLKVAGGLVLLLGGLNLGNLFLARGLERAKSQSLHRVLGAPRVMLIWGVLCEAVLVGAAGGLGAFAVTRLALAGLGLAEPTILTAPLGVTFDPTVWRADGGQIAGSVGVCVAAALVFSLVPAWRTTRGDGMAPLGRGPGVTGGGLRQLGPMRPRGSLVVLETAAALAVTLPALLLVRSLGSLVTADLGFRADAVMAAELRLPTAQYAPREAAAFVDQATHRLLGSPQIASASWTSCLPVRCGFYTSALASAGSPREGVLASVHTVAPRAFRTLGIPLRSGRDFAATDHATAPPVAVLSETAARLVGVEAPGSRVVVATLGGDAREVVGIVGDVPYRDLSSAPLPAVYLPLAQTPLTEGFLIARTAEGSRSVRTILGRVVESLDASLATPRVEALAPRVERDVARFRGATWLLGVAAALALLLCAIGIYGVLWSLVAQSLHEIAIRIALGAAPASIARSIAAAALRLAAVGLPLGAGLGTWGGAQLRNYLYGVHPWDARAFSWILAVSAGLALLAAVRPAVRASRTEPMLLLRSP